MAVINSENVASAWRRAAVNSLLTWRRASPDDPLDDEERYGWWGDSFPTQANDRIGSRLWQLRRRKLTATTERDAEAFARESLQWMLDDGRVTRIDITTLRGVDRLDLRVVLHMREGGPIELFLDNLWLVIHAV